jgi:diguanylate cyclase (GGDEF)-like protein/PAS domain S-box-containing protein
VTATDNELASPPPHGSSPDDRAASPSAVAPPSIMDEIEALAALVGETEEQSDSPIPAPTASIARSRPMLTTPVAVSTSDETVHARVEPSVVSPASSPDVAAPTDVAAVADDDLLAPAVTPLTIEPLSLEPLNLDSPASDPVVADAIADPVAPDVVPIEPVRTFPIDADSPLADMPVDATIPMDRLAPGDVLDGLSVPAPPAPPAPPSGSSNTPYPSGVLSDASRLVVLDAMPVAVFLIDSMATIRFANQRTADMLGLTREEFLGRSVLDFVNTADIDFAAELFNVGTRWESQMMGPSRIRYVDSSGQSHWTQVWAQACPEELGIEGYIVSLTSESVRDVLATAVSSVAADDTIDHTLKAIALSARALPLDGIGAVLMPDPSAGDSSTELRMIGDWPIDDKAINALGTPWRKALEEGVACDIDDVAASGLAPAARQLLGEAGVAALFVRPIVDANRTAVGVLVVFRSEAGTASPNQEDHLIDAIRLAGMAFGQKRRRLELETAALRDFLTGVGNRAALNDRLKTERRAADVLFIDLDRFKAVNDTYGHDVGDQVVSMAAGRIENTVRRDDRVYRTGGDEFVVLCEASGDDETERVVLAERIIDRLKEPFAIGDDDIRIGATVGIAAAGDRSLLDTVRAADQALYAAKEQGGAGWAHDET